MKFFASYGYKLRCGEEYNDFTNNINARDIYYHSVVRPEPSLLVVFTCPCNTFK